MNIVITRQSRGEFNTHVSFMADGVAHTAIVYPQERSADSKVFAFGANGDDCTRTYRINNPGMLAAVVSAIS